jgi:alpha-N-arabinofuranosidase
MSLVNIDAKKKNTVEIPIADLGVKTFSGTLLTSENLQDHNTFDSPTKIKPQEYKVGKVKNGMVQVELPPFSVVVLKGDK